MIPAGIIVPYAGTTSPDTAIWLLCDGAAVSRTTYAVLFALISTTFGVGNGSTTFNVPDLRGRTIIALDNLGGASANRVTNAQADSLGGTQGSETHTLTTAETPSHTHTGTTSTLDVNVTTRTPVDVAGGGGSFTALESAAGTTLDHNHTFTTDATGGGGAHENMSPYMAMGYLIKT